MSKAKIIKALIEAGNPFEKVVELSGAKESFVKAQYTKLKLDWKTASIGEEDEPEVKSEEPEVETPEAESAEAETELQEEITVDVEVTVDDETETAQVVIEDPVTDKEVTAEVKIPSLTHIRCVDRLKAANKNPGKGLLKNRSIKYREKAEKILTEFDFKPENMLALNSRYACIKPRPNNMNCHRLVFKLHKDMTLLFREKFNQR